MKSTLKLPNGFNRESTHAKSLKRSQTLMTKIHIMKKKGNTLHTYNMSKISYGFTLFQVSSVPKPAARIECQTHFPPSLHRLRVSILRVHNEVVKRYDGINPASDAVKATTADCPR